MSTDKEDLELIQTALNGDKKALETLILAHYDFIYNVAIRMVFNEADALDITQDIVVKIITNLSSFKKNISFKGWLYRITVNHFLNLKKRPIEKSVTTFTAYGRGLDEIKNEMYVSQSSSELQLIIKEIEISCTRGMLMCLSRSQRVMYIFGEILEIGHILGAHIFETTKENYRKQLSRVRMDMHSFMNDKCGLVNPENPCRCKNKTKGFIEKGWVNPEEKTFTREYNKSVNEVLELTAESMKHLVPIVSQKVYQSQPFYTPENKYKLLKDLKFKEI